MRITLIAKIISYFEFTQELDILLPLFIEIFY